MFTGIIEEVGELLSLAKKSNSATIKVSCKKILEATNVGDSIATNGVCLTATKVSKDFFEADISYETVARSSLQNLKTKDKLNLERALSLSSRLGGHLVSGHVDDVATIGSVSKSEDSYILKIKFPERLGKYIVEKGSLALDGISLTVADVSGNVFEVAVIPHTFNNTNLAHKKAGDILNIEIDQMARYIEKLIKSEDKDKKLLSLISNMR